MLPRPRMSSTCRPNRPSSGGCRTTCVAVVILLVKPLLFRGFVVVDHEEAGIRGVYNTNLGHTVSGLTVPGSLSVAQVGLRSCARALSPSGPSTPTFFFGVCRQLDPKGPVAWMLLGLKECRGDVGRGVPTSVGSEGHDVVAPILDKVGASVLSCPLHASGSRKPWVMSLASPLGHLDHFKMKCASKMRSEGMLPSS